MVWLDFGGGRHRVTPGVLEQRLEVALCCGSVDLLDLLGGCFWFSLFWLAAGRGGEGELG